MVFVVDKEKKHLIKRRSSEKRKACYSKEESRCCRVTPSKERQQREDITRKEIAQGSIAFLFFKWKACNVSTFTLSFCFSHVSASVSLSSISSVLVSSDFKSYRENGAEKTWNEANRVQDVYFYYSTLMMSLILLYLSSCCKRNSREKEKSIKHGSWNINQHEKRGVYKEAKKDKEKGRETGHKAMDFAVH